MTQPLDTDPYWTHTVVIGDGDIQGREHYLILTVNCPIGELRARQSPSCCHVRQSHKKRVMLPQGHKSLIRLHLHRSEERAYHGESLFPIAVKRGDTKTYFHAKPYILIPQMTFTVGLTRPKADSNEIGRVIGSDVSKLQVREIGNAQAWYYPEDKALVLWECYLFEPYAQKDPKKDPLLATVWQEFEKTLLKELPDTAKIYTTYEPIYERPIYKAFLAKQGYRPVEKVAFVKEVE